MQTDPTRQRESEALRVVLLIAPVSEAYDDIFLLLVRRISEENSDNVVEVSDFKKLRHLPFRANEMKVAPWKFVRLLEKEDGLL